MKTIRKKLTKNTSSCIAPFKAVHVGSRTEIYPNDIIMISADISYSNIHLSSGKQIIVSTNIQKLEERFLPFLNMVRVHRSFMINTQFLKNIEGINAFMTNDLHCVISRRKRVDLLNAIQLKN